MDELLTPVSTTYRAAGNDTRPLLDEIKGSGRPGPEPRLSRPPSFPPSSPEEAIEALKNEPDYDTLVTALRFLSRKSAETSWNILVPSAQSAQAVQTLVTNIVPNYWTLLEEASPRRGKPGKNASPSDLDLLLNCLRSITGINAVIVRLRALIQDGKLGQGHVKRPDTALNLRIMLDLLSSMLDGASCLSQLWANSIAPIESSIKRKPLVQEVVTLVGGGRIVSVSAEADEIAKQDGKSQKPHWISDGAEYSQWLAHNLTTWATQQSSEEQLKACSDLFVKTMRLGSFERVMKHFIHNLVQNASSDGPCPLVSLLGRVPPMEQKKVLYSVLKLLPEDHLKGLASMDDMDAAKLVAAAAGLIHRIIGGSEVLKNHLVSWLTNSAGAGLGEDIGVRRSAVAVAAQDKEAIVNVLEKSLGQFGDQLYIKHSPMLQQEAHAQVLLLSAGYVHRISPIKLAMLLRTGLYMNAVSNRIGASQIRARFLGMVVGETLSGLVDKGGKKLDFHMDELDTDEARWYKSLVDIADSPGPIDPFRTEMAAGQPRKEQKPAPKAAPKPTAPMASTGFIIEEVEDESEDEDLVPYAKPDSDPEDSDDDPTLVTRDKPKAPVYIRDLVTYLRDSENYDRQKLGLTTAPVLIRRKANFGTEVSSHVEDLASLLVGIQDKFELEDFYELKTQGMIAVLVAQPKTMGPWFAKTFFDGDYSISQRASILVVLGLSAREIAGFETSEHASAASFPSKLLPERLEKLYVDETSRKKLTPSSSSLKGLPPNAIDTMASSLTSSLVAPIAATAADAATGPDVLKLSTFTARLQTTQGADGKPRTRPRPRPRVRAIPNTTAKLLADAVFFPLTARFQQAMRLAGGRPGGRGVVFEPHLLALYVRTLALVLHAAGPATLARPAMTAELWDLLLGVVRGGAEEAGVAHAVLFALLALLDVNEDRMRDVCAELGREVVETMEWAGAVFERTRGGGGGDDSGGGSGGEENEVKMLAAAVLIRLREAVEKYRALLVGDLIDF